MKQSQEKLFPELMKTISKIDPSRISRERKTVLNDLIVFIQAKSDHQEAINLNFICTHNSRRSHLSQVWAQTLAAHFNISGFTAYSGGTEATALFPAVTKTFKISGFRIEKLSETENPVYSIKYGPISLPVIGFSKTYDHGFNPQGEFGAVMTCSQADASCPVVAGASKRFPITFEDPKAFDGTPLQAEKYKERSLQIATELFYVFSKIK